MLSALSHSPELNWHYSKTTIWPMNELIFEVSQENDGSFCAECLTESIFTHAKNWEQLRDNVREATRAYYFDQPKNLPGSIRLHLVHDEIIAFR